MPPAQTASQVPEKRKLTDIERKETHFHFLVDNLHFLIPKASVQHKNEALSNVIKSAHLQIRWAALRNFIITWHKPSRWMLGSFEGRTDSASR